MFLTGKHMSRRTALQGLGATSRCRCSTRWCPRARSFAKTAAGRAAGPARASSASSRCTARRAAASSARRSILWNPAVVGRSFDLSKGSLSPLEPFRDYLTIVSNTDARMAEAFAPAEVGGDHFRSSAVMYTHVRPKLTEGSDVRVGTSMDQLYVQKFGQDTPIPSMQLSIEPVDQSGGCAYGYACVYTDTISWAARGSAAADGARSAHGVRAAVRRRRHAGTARARRATDRSILDMLTEQMAGLRRSIGPRTGSASISTPTNIREIEQRISRIEARNLSGEMRELPGAPAGVPDSFDEHVKLMFDLQVLAFTSDTTRVFSFKFGRDGSGRVYPRQRHRYAASTTPRTTARPRSASGSSARSTSTTCRCCRTSWRSCRRRWTATRTCSTRR